MVALVMSNQKVAFCSFYVMLFQNAFWDSGNLVFVSLLTFAPFCLLFEEPHYFYIIFFSYLIYIFTFLNGCQNSSGITGFTCMLFVLFPDGSLFFLWFTYQDLSSGDNNFNVLSASFYFIMLSLALEGSANLTKQKNAKGNRIATSETFDGRGMRGKGAWFCFY